MTVRRKLTAQVMGFNFSLQVLNVVVGAVIFTVLSWTDHHYAEAVKKVEEASGVSRPPRLRPLSLRHCPQHRPENGRQLQVSLESRKTA